MPRKTIFFPCACRRFQVLSSRGASSLHGSHHAAHKFKTMGLPLKFVSERSLFPVWGLSIASEKLGAGWPMRGSDEGCDAGVSNCVRRKASNAIFSRLTPHHMSMLRLRLFLRMDP